MRVAIVATLVVACGAPAQPTARPTGSGSEPGPRFAITGDAPAIAVVDLVGETGPYQYAAHREASGVDTDLFAACVDRGRVWVGGDGGVILHRTYRGGWHREPTPTTRAIRALVAATDEGDHSGDMAGPDVPIYAVGDGGVILRRSPDGAWSQQKSPTTNDLFAIAAGDHVLYATGAHGTVLAHDATGWRVIASHTDADLRHYDDGIVVGAGGAIVDCIAWDREQRELARSIACVPRASPTTADLYTMIRGAGGSSWHALGADGVDVELGHHRPADATTRAVIPGAPTLLAGTDNHGWSSVGELATILVGRGGAVTFVAATGPVSVTLEPRAALFAVVVDELDAFAVGAGGTIVHLQTRGVTIPIITVE